MLRVKSYPILLLIAVVAALLAWPTLAQQGAVQSNTPAALVYDQVSPSVVAISAIVDLSAAQGNVPNFPNIPNSPNIPRQNVAGGSGFVIDTQGHIVTNAHVVENATRIEVNFLDGTLVRATLVGLDLNSDLAVIKVNLPAEQLKPAVWGDSNALDIGQEVYAIGSPFGQRWTLTRGIISALDRTIGGLTQFSIGGVIQTDAAINPGNSGGPLLNEDGEVIGINSQIRSESGSNSGVGFAIPSNLARRVANELIQTGQARYSYLGISGGDVTLPIIEQFNLPNNTRGVVVNDIVNGSPSANAGLRRADLLTQRDGQQIPTQVDIITAINGQPLRGMNDLISYLAQQTQPGDTVTLSVLRNGRERLEVTVTLGERPRN
ncbi:MAG: trypsin-like peptidase domain-containing protein [Anaerolineae bacterium]|nr:trypsin-like peptidase domain-containing protein [Anaerolineae bacterium]MDW8171248.1 trypsin-like peptidase domain-containing protein [Anaerolineae bacterium]